MGLELVLIAEVLDVSPRALRKWPDQAEPGAQAPERRATRAHDSVLSMTENELDLVVRAIGALVGLLALAIGWSLAPSPARKASMAVALAIGVFSFPGVHAWGRKLLHSTELFHYVLGCKYFPELGYFGLYDATARATREVNLPLATHVRNLRSGELEPAVVGARRAEQLPFSPARWQSFRDDLLTLNAVSEGYYAAGVFDHGFNASPAWIALGRSILGDAPITPRLLYFCPILDLILLGLVLAGLLAVFGLENTAIAALLLGTSVTWRFAWIGESFLRYDWVVVLGAALVALRKQRFAVAGACLAWSTVLRLFPVFFAAAAVVPIALRLRDRTAAVAARRFALGFLGMVVVAWIAGSMAGRGPGAWSEYAERIRAHHSAWSTNLVGLDSVAVLDTVLQASDTEGLEWIDRVAESRASRRPYLLPVFLTSLLVTAWVARRLPPWRAMLLGVIPVYCASAIAGYYWVMLWLLPFSGVRRTSILLIATTPVAVLVEMVSASQAITHVSISILYLLILSDWAFSLSRTGRE